MKHVVIRAKFIGQNLSLGYVNGKFYDLVLKAYIGGGINIHRHSDGGGACDYTSIFKFLENWDDITSIKD